MDRIKGAGHVNNRFVEEDEKTGRPPTELTAKWFNDVQEEICNVISAANIELNGDDQAQLLQAIRGIISGRLATEEVAGIARIATAEEAAAGEDDGLIITPAKLASALQNIITLPVGFMTMWPSATLPAGGKWMERNGDILSVADYPGLFAILGNIYGGDGTTTFALPDDRGLVERGWDHGRGYDSARTFGSEQADAIRNIYGNIYSVSEQFGEEGSADGAFYKLGNASVPRTPTFSGSGVDGRVGFSASQVVPTAPENRVRNRAYLPIIKALS